VILEDFIYLTILYAKISGKGMKGIFPIFFQKNKGENKCREMKYKYNKKL
jgi:hypothetical protein